MKGCEVILINLSSTRGNQTHAFEELGIKRESMLGEEDYRKGRDVFNVKKSYRNRNRELRMINLELMYPDKKGWDTRREPKPPFSLVVPR